LTECIGKRSTVSIDDKYIDLHMHSTVSDGTWDVEEIARMIKSSNVGIYSITDHDNISGVLDGEKYAHQNGLNYIHGVEVSSSLDGDWEHVLAYGVDVKNEALNKLLKENREKIRDKDSFSVKHLERIGFSVSHNEFESYDYDIQRGGFKVLNYLIDKGICKDVHEFFSMFADIPEVVGFPVYREMNQVVDVIKAAGGVPVIAHPFYTTGEVEDLQGRLKRFSQMGIEGIECFHPSHDIQVAKACMDYCKRNDLSMTVGSDCHGFFAPRRKIGMHSIKVSDISIGKLRNYIL